MNLNEEDLHQWHLLNNFHETYKNFSRGQIEWLYRNRNSNGFSNAFCKLGRKRYVHAGRLASLLSERIEN